jgi:hypothetical protein
MHLNFIADNLQRWTSRMNPGLLSTIAQMPTYLVPPSSASVIRSWSKRHLVNLEAITDAVLIDEQGAVALFNVVEEKGRIAPEHALLITKSMQADTHVTDSIPAFPITYKKKSRFVIVQRNPAHSPIEYSWSQGEVLYCGSIPMGDKIRPVIDIHFTLDDSKTQFDNGDLVTMTEICSHTGQSPTEAWNGLATDITNSIVTAMEQLDHIHRGCSLRSGSRGTIVLTE